MSEKHNPAFYESTYVPSQRSEFNSSADLLGNPHAIYNYLLSQVYKQDDYAKDAAMFLFNHARGIPQRLFVCGPSGSGKTYMFECIKRIWPHTIIENAATITGQGWKGDNKITSFLCNIDFTSKEKYICVFDEFDKLASPSWSSHGENLSASTQSELLKLVEGEKIPVQLRTEHGIDTVMVDTYGISFVFCGSFAKSAGEIAEKESSKQIGFISQNTVHSAFDRKLNIQDLIDEGGVILELASRVTRISNVRPLSVDDYKYLIKSHTGSPLRKLEKAYGLKLNIDDSILDSIAEEAFRSKLGVRNATARLQELIDNKLFDCPAEELPNLREIDI